MSGDFFFLHIFSPAEFEIRGKHFFMILILFLFKGYRQKLVEFFKKLDLLTQSFLAFSSFGQFSSGWSLLLRRSISFT